MHRIKIGKNISLYDFLEEYRVHEKGGVHTHTSMNKPVGSFNIPEDKQELFFSLYEKAFVEGKKLSLIEKHNDVGPIIIDIDLRYNGTEEKRQFTEQHIKQIVKYYMEEIEETFEYKKNKYEELVAFIFTRDKPYTFIQKRKVDKEVKEVCENTLENKDNEILGEDIEEKEYVTIKYIKDGIHIAFPYIISEPTVQHLIRENVIKRAQQDEIFTDIELKHYNYPEIFDKSIIDKNGWFMYGATKPELTPYNLTNVYDSELNSLDWSNGEVDFQGEDNMAKFFSIRRFVQDDCQKIKESKQNDLNRIFKKNKTITMNKIQKMGLGQDNSNNDIKVIAKLVSILNTTRSDKYETWIEVGWCLHNINAKNPDMLQIWIDFSKKSPKFKDGECEYRWMRFKNEGFGLGSLHYWAKNDNYEAYMEIRREDIQYYIIQSINNTNCDIARVLYAMYREQFICSSIKNNIWYEFKNHRWIEIDGGVYLRMKISNELVYEYSNMMTHYNNCAKTDGISEGEKETYLEKSSLLLKITLTIKNTKTKDNIMKECKELFYIEKFDEKLDSNPYLLGFNNGIYDLKSYQFRDGRPEDYVCFTTGYDYIVIDNEDERMLQLKKIFNEVFVKDEVREYMLLVWASCLQGVDYEQKFRMATGTGANSKGMLNKLMLFTLGEYCNSFPTSLFTQKRGRSNAANPEVIEAKGKRYCYLDETNEDEKINPGLMKQYTGRDLIKGRGLYDKKLTSFIPQWKIFLFCNDMPQLPPHDGGIWRRVEVIEYKSKFVENPRKPNEFKMDPTLEEKLPTLKEAFMTLLLQYYKKYRQFGITPPYDVIKYTQNYQKDNDMYHDFIDNYLHKLDDSDKCESTLSEIMLVFKDWYLENVANDGKCPTNEALKKYLIKVFGKDIFKGKFIKGYKVIPMNCFNDDPEQDNY